jgi:hypothetical protein
MVMHIDLDDKRLDERAFVVVHILMFLMYVELKTVPQYPMLPEGESQQ